MNAIGVEALPLFPRARSSDPDTSHHAARQVADAVGAQRLAIVEALAHAKERGMTAYELDEALGWRKDNRGRAGRRMKDLLTLGTIARTTKKRGTSGGCSGYVYVLTLYAEAA